MSKTPENTPAADEQLDLVHDLVWQLLDEQLEEEGFQQLSTLLIGSESARKAYVELVQLHVSLLDHFGRLPDAQTVLNEILAQATAPGKAEAQPAAESQQADKSAGKKAGAKKGKKGRTGDVDVSALPEIDTTEHTGV